MASSGPFSPSATTTIAASTTSASATLLGAGDVAVIYNSTTAVAFVLFGSGALTATAAAFPVPPSGRVIVQTGGLVTNAAVILSTGSGNVYITLGSGSNI